ncbi:MAG: hypothetical protein V4858_04455 [Pseudomonadota bacterium]
MQDVTHQATQAAAAIKELETLYAKFVQCAKAPSPNWKPELGNIAAASTGITCYGLGCKITATPRAVALQGRIQALEFDFVHAWEGSDRPLLRLYLQANGWFTRDIIGQQRFYAHDDPGIKDDLVLELCTALLASPVFTPKLSTAAAADTTRVVNLGASHRAHVQAVG